MGTSNRLPVAALAAGLGLFVVLPLVAVLREAPPLATWWALWASPEASAALTGTLVTSCGAALFAFALGVPLALLVTRTQLPGAAMLRPLLTVPTAVPPFIFAMGWVSLANPKAGLLNQLAHEGFLNIYGRLGIAFVLGASELPLVFLATAAALSRLDSALEEAARLSGASPARALWSVSLPLALPAALSGTSLVFLSAASAFGVPYLLGVTASPPVPTLTTRIASEVMVGGGGLSRSAVLSVELVVMGLVVLASLRWAARLGRVQLLAGKGGRLVPLPLGRWRWPAAFATWSLTTVLVVLPLFAVFLTSVQPTFGQWSGFTGKHWGHVLTAPRTLTASATSLGLALAAASLITLLALAIAATRSRPLELFADAPWAIPGTVLALALLVAFSRDTRFIVAERFAFVFAPENSLWLVLIALVVKYLALGVRNASEGLSQADLSLAEAARLSGAGRLRAFVDGIIPQLRAPLAAAFVLTFLLCLTELTMSVLLLPPGHELFGPLLFELESYADPASAAVLACAFVLVVLALFALQTHLATRRERHP
jgi:iron(III) transport system permease protein